MKVTTLPVGVDGRLPDTPHVDNACFFTEISS